MADLLSTGISGVRTYQRALATVGNNIANVDTDGYVRQRLEIVENSSTGSGVLNIGNGARAVKVQRIYDEFVTTSMRTNIAQLEQHEAVLKYAQQLENTLADKNLSLSSVIDGYFAAVQEVTISPSSASARQSMLNSAETVAGQFQSIGAQIQQVEDDSWGELEAKTEELNRLATQLASVNDSLSRTVSLEKQPNELLDMRDTLLRDMSELVRIYAEVEDNGEVNVHIGDADSDSAGYLVHGDQATVVGVQQDTANPENAILLLNPYTNPQPVGSVMGGAIGGIMHFRSEVLQGLRDDLDNVAKVFVNENNAIHELGINAYGQFGGDLFSLSNVYTLEAGLNQGNSIVNISTLSDVDIEHAPMELSYESSTNTWTLLNLNTNASTSRIGNGDLELGGLRVDVSGTPVGGDVFSLTPSKRPIDAIEVAISDQSAIAAGGALSVSRDGTNVNETRMILDSYHKPSLPADDTSMDDLLRNNISEVAGTSVLASTAPAFVIPAYTQNPRFYLDNEGVGADVQMQVFTRDGRQVYGTELSSAEQNQMLSPVYGFSVDAQYNTDYLNKTGTDAYMDGNFAVTNPDNNDTRQFFGLQGHLGEDLIVFVAGTGSGHMSGQWDAKVDIDAREVLRQNIDIEFSDENSYELIDANTGTSIANGTLANNSIQHNGWQVSFEGPVAAGSKFQIRGNTYMSGDNRNILSLAELQSSKAAFGGQGDFTEVYTDIIGDLGNQVIQTSISSDAQRIMVDQAQEQWNQTSAVSLDEEAADLLRFQQAYQASAQVISTANKLFESILQLG
jgi:flagellar hook-associated protein 1 FlgK